jgi:hypothetical protein
MRSGDSLGWICFENRTIHGATLFFPDFSGSSRHRRVWLLEIVGY